MFQNSMTLDLLLERCQCTHLGPKLIFCVFSHHFVAAPNPLWKSISGALNARVYASETISCFVATNMPNLLFKSKTHVLGGFMPFRSRTWHVAITGIEVHLMHEFMPLEPFLGFLQQICPINYFRSKTYVLVGFAPFCCHTRPFLVLQSFWRQLM